MSIWEILGLMPTKDLRVIRRAYATAAAKYNPEEHPEKFLVVRNAYEQAMRYAQEQNQPLDTPKHTVTQPEQPKEETQSKGIPDMGGFTFPEESELEESIVVPAIDEFLKLYCSRQRRDRKQWDLWFTSPQFLAVYQNPRFTQLLKTTVEERKKEFLPTKEFQTALAVAYQFRAETSQDHTEFILKRGAGFEGIEDILQIAAMGPLVKKLHSNDAVMSIAYQDYKDLCNLAQEGVWDLAALKLLREILGCYSSAYLYERCPGHSQHERNIISLRLLETFFSNRTMPEDVYKILWDTFDLNTAIMGRNKVFYGHLREIVIRKAPEVCSGRERFVELRAAYHNLGSHVQAAGGEDSPQGYALIDEFMTREDFFRAIRSPLFVREEILRYWCSYFPNPYFLHRLLVIYQENPSLPYASDVLEVIQLTLSKRAEVERAKQEREMLSKLALQTIHQDCCTLSHPLFLRYFLKTAFYWLDEMDSNDLCTFLEENFASNPVWNRRLAQAGLSRSISIAQHGINEYGQCTEKVLEIQLYFHQFYVEYHINQQVQWGPSLPFWDISQIEDDELVLLLLPILHANQEECKKVAAHLEERLTRLGLSSHLCAPLAVSLAREVACCIETKNDNIFLRPMYFCRESKGMLCYCAWYRYSNERLCVFQKTEKDSVLLERFCQEYVTTLEQASHTAEEILDKLFRKQNDSIDCLSGMKIELCRHIYVEYSNLSNQDFGQDTITSALLEQLLQDFETKRVTRLVVNHNLVLLWNQRNFMTNSVQVGTCALLRFQDLNKRWGGLLSNENRYYYTQADEIQQIPFRMGFLPDYIVHDTPEKAIETLIAILSGAHNGNAKWTEKVYLHNGEYHYYFFKRALGGFSLEEVGCPLLRHRYVLSRLPHHFSYREPGQTTITQEVNGVTRLTLTDQLVRFELDGLEYLSMSWELEEVGPVHIVLLRRREYTASRDLAVLIQDRMQSIEYLVWNQSEYRNREQENQEEIFWDHVYPNYLIHRDFVSIRDFLDVFLLGLPHIKSLLHNHFVTLVPSSSFLPELGFEEHRRWLLEPKEDTFP